MTHKPARQTEQEPSGIAFILVLGVFVGCSVSASVSGSVFRSDATLHIGCQRLGSWISVACGLAQASWHRGYSEALAAYQRVQEVESAADKELLAEDTICLT